MILRLHKPDRYYMPTTRKSPYPELMEIRFR